MLGIDMSICILMTIYQEVYFESLLCISDLISEYFPPSPMINKLSNFTCALSVFMVISPKKNLKQAICVQIYYISFGDK